MGWDHVERMRGEFAPLAAAQLTVDAIEHNLDQVLAAIGD
ncbi:hypothetical protein GCM10009765_77990 [Fodinicola feengrottensis]|uniref:Uncharacterized protein n=1 Tax=Fodinicola feengrottensis TaxID=435914 RepID=A0ABN2J4M6_9ACTN